MNLTENKIFQVSELNGIVKEILDETFANILIEGEISNLRKASSGHFYFDLKDKTGLIPAVMFKGYAWQMKQDLQDGTNVLLRADLSCYIKQGRYQLIVKSVQTKSKGDLFLEFEKLKKTLKSEGLFDDDHKKPIPQRPKKVGVITSLEGAGLKDILSVLKRRSPNLEVIICGSLVQGDDAKFQLVEAIENLNNLPKKPDVILFGRGGGSIEDLWAFNEEIVARAIYKSKVPIISCVGHQTDFTISDFVSDLRAETPTAAAQIISEANKDTVFYLKTISSNLINTFENYYQQLAQELDGYADDIEINIENLLNTKEDKLANTLDKLNSLSPLSVLKRGFSLAIKKSGEIIKQKKDVKTGEKIKIKTHKDTIDCEVL
ncbi:MAG: exodeoxyribonuclease VII large subunit [Elusimicrobiaceae bacterium]|jgi:exodeoxyribonuclease VII large subunit|nr:exodeoxyribonuclease VII large subunit [Elusimicrobiaceae bacterium]MBT3954886.1 exodeoxyribonuclease VII large subunit [Elusimicrobiaceae bacterium]MBT4008367.1 exodeoxyribonuclease VII large subunit [Elusimicrobiaceae bacterium]MBT4439452.1 exodeoxyribonuclease VII large subunit [Elusimicrobiaceae bacterium]MBT5987383.1 exodeoxyribonuclease VII large subunit [Elusimicrobiaceae bacterium]